MALALPLIVNLFSPVLSAVDWLAGGPTAQRSRTGAERGLGDCASPRPARTVHGESTHAKPPCRKEAGRLDKAWGGPIRASYADPSPRAVRVVRVVEERVARVHAGRMVISGRLADVCAELERLAALETAR